MRAFVIEDEPLALARFKTMLQQLAPHISIAGAADSVRQAKAWLKDHSEPDVIFTDIELADGNCFALFENYKPSCPVIFITAFHSHAIEAFKVNAVDYLLKPLKAEDLQRALAKIARPGTAPAIDYAQLAQAVLAEQNKFNRRYIIRFGDQIRTLQSDDIAYIYTLQKSVFAKTFSGKDYPLDKSLDALESELDPSKFFRINRQFIVHIKAISQMQTASKSRVQLELSPPFKHDEVIVSTERSPVFKDWLGQ